MKLRWKTAQFFEVIWWWFYLSRKDKEDYLEKKKLYWQKLLKDCAGSFVIKPGETIIDMGCGPSGLYILFPDSNMTAVDPLLDKYEQNLPVFSRKAYPGVRFVCSPIEAYTTSETFDYVFCMNAINHVADIRKGFATLARLGGPKAKLIVTIDAHTMGWMKAVFRIGPGDILHPHQYDKEEYIAFIEDEGYKVTATICLEKGMVFDHYLLVAERA